MSLMTGAWVMMGCQLKTVAQITQKTCCQIQRQMVFPHDQKMDDQMLASLFQQVPIQEEAQLKDKFVDSILTAMSKSKEGEICVSSYGDIDVQDVQIVQ